MTTDKWKNEKKIDNETNAFMQVRKAQVKTPYTYRCTGLVTN